MTRLTWLLLAASSLPLPGLLLAHCSNSSTPREGTPDAPVGSVHTSGSGSSGPCGAAGQPCCGIGQTCNSGLLCEAISGVDAGDTDAGDESMCAPCGSPGQPCCVDPSTQALSCTGAGVSCYTVDPMTLMVDAAPPPPTCKNCGGIGAPCCANNTCPGAGANGCCDTYVNSCIGADAKCAEGPVCTGGSCAP